ncbi:MAG: hypothetical protein AAF802_11095 [Planctomycetota bacterium]
MNQATASSEREEKKPRHLSVVIGCFLILCSGVCFFTMLAVPLLDMSTAAKGILGGALFVGVQVGWWVGVALMGPAAIAGIRNFFVRQRKASQPKDLDDKNAGTD